MKNTTLTSKISTLTLILFFISSISSFAITPKEDPIIVSMFHLNNDNVEIDSVSKIVDSTILTMELTPKEDPIIVSM